MKKEKKPSVHWYSVKRKKPIAYSTTAESDALSIINWPNRTANELMDLLNSGKYIAVHEMKRIVQAYIDIGAGDEIIRTRRL